MQNKCILIISVLFFLLSMVSGDLVKGILLGSLISRDSDDHNSKLLGSLISRDSDDQNSKIISLSKSMSEKPTTQPTTTTKISQSTTDESDMKLVPIELKTSVKKVKTTSTTLKTGDQPITTDIQEEIDEEKDLENQWWHKLDDEVEDDVHSNDDWSYYAPQISEPHQNNQFHQYPAINHFY